MFTLTLLDVTSFPVCGISAAPQGIGDAALVKLAVQTASPPAQRTAQKKKRRLRKPDVIYYPTPPETVAEMLRLASIKKGDVLYDLGSGDGRIPIAAAEAIWHSRRRNRDRSES